MSGSTIKIGVLGGIGPEATGEFYNKLIKGLQKRGFIRANSDFPQIIINSIPAPELVFDKISKSDLRQYIEGVKLLDRLGVDFIVMVCNTIHLYHERLQKEITAPILDLRKEVKRVLVNEKGKVLVLGTPSTIKNKLYEFDGLEYTGLEEKELDRVSKAILDFNRGRKPRELGSICRKYQKKGAMIILACTEIALMLENEKIPNINTVDVLVDATINKFLSLKYPGSEIINKGDGYNR